MNIQSMVNEITPEILEICRIIHQNPELGLKEYNTCALIENYLKANVRYEKMKRVGETGIFVEIKGAKPGPGKIIAFRGDIDALPIQESNCFDFPSKTPNVMHACGHDVHCVINLGAARVLSNYRESFSGSVYFFFQPAEEILAGAKLFLNDPEIDFSKINAMVAAHSSPEIYAGTIGVRNGPILASADKINIKITGKQGHAAHPHTVIDPIVTASNIILSLQTLVSRETAPLDSAVVSFGSIHGGDTHNIIPATVDIVGTLRTISPETRTKLRESIHRICDGIAAAMRAQVEVNIEDGVPPLLNDSPQWVDRTIRVGTKLLGKDNVIILPGPSMGGDDFAFLKENREGVFIRLGSRTPGGPYGSMHSPTFYSDKAAIPTGMLTLAGIALDFLDVEY